MLIGIDPKVDYAFKYVLGRESTRPILVDVIEKVLDLPEDFHLEIELLNPFNEKEALDDKLSILDIKARDQLGRQFNLEMQMVSHAGYDKRIVYYAAKMHQQQMHEGDDYLDLKPTISISFLNHILFADVADHHLRFRLLEEAHYFALSDDIEFHILELPKFTKSAEQLATGLDNWLYFFRHAEKIDTEMLPSQLQEPLVMRALEELKMLGSTDVERERYESRRKAQLDYNTGIRAARLEGLAEGLTRGREEGLEQGLTQGLEQGLTQGLEQGLTQGLEQGLTQGLEQGLTQGLEQGLVLGRAEGEQLGRVQELVGKVQFCENLLKQTITPGDQLVQLPLDELIQLADSLQQRVLGEK